MTIDRESIAMLRRAGLCICEARMIESHHPGLMNDDLVLTRIEEGEGRAEYEARMTESKKESP